MTGGNSVRSQSLEVTGLATWLIPEPRLSPHPGLQCWSFSHPEHLLCARHPRGTGARSEGARLAPWVCHSPSEAWEGVSLRSRGKMEGLSALAQLPPLASCVTLGDYHRFLCFYSTAVKSGK